MDQIFWGLSTFFVFPSNNTDNQRSCRGDSVSPRALGDIGRPAGDVTPGLKNAPRLWGQSCPRAYRSGWAQTQLVPQEKISKSMASTLVQWIRTGVGGSGHTQAHVTLDHAGGEEI